MKKPRHKTLKKKKKQISGTQDNDIIFGMSCERSKKSLEELPKILLIKGHDNETLVMNWENIANFFEELEKTYSIKANKKGEINEKDILSEKDLTEIAKRVISST